MPSSSRRWIWIGLVALGVGLLNFGIEVSDRLAAGESGVVTRALIYELTGVLSALPMVPLLLWLFRNFPLERGFYLRRLPVYLVCLVAFGLSHTTLMTLSRTVILDLLDLGPYRPGVMVYRYLMEFHKQALIFALIYGAHSLFRYLEHRRAQEVAAAELREQLSRARLEALRLRLNPHFLFNTLNLVSARMYEDPDVADRLLSSLSLLLRAAMSDRQEVSLREEMEVLELYLKIMEERFGSRLEVVTRVAPEVLDCRFPSLSLQPLVENSLRHGLEGAGLEVLKLEIEAARTHGGDSLTVVVADNGPGLSDEPAAGTGIGLSSVRERLQVLYGADHTLTLKDRSEGGLRVEIRIPAIPAVGGKTDVR